MHPLQTNSKNNNLCNLILNLFEQQQFGNLYLGSYRALNEQTVEKFNIKTVLTVLDKQMYEIYKIKQVAQKVGISSYLWIDVEDNQGVNVSEEIFVRSYEFIDENIKKYNILVHSQGGISRSASFVIYYLMRKNKLSFNQARKLVISKRSTASPNDGFMKVLRKHQDNSKQQKCPPSQNSINKERTIIDPPSKYSTKQFPQKFCNHIVCIYEQCPLQKGNLFLGQFSTLNPNIMKALQLKTVLTVIDESYYKRMKIKEIIEHEQIQNHLWLDIKDQGQENLDQHFRKTFQFIDKHIQEGNVLVHCQAGVSRSASIVIAYIIAKFKVPFDVAAKFVRSKRHVIRPNQGFQEQLIKYSKQTVE